MLQELFPNKSKINVRYDDLNDKGYHGVLIDVLSKDLNFHNSNSRYASHNFHSFPAKFPPQLPAQFIQRLTKPGDTVLDPMAGSGTTLVEAYLNDRIAIGFDIDPLAILLSKVKTSPLNYDRLYSEYVRIIRNAENEYRKNPSKLMEIAGKRWDEETCKFVNYWFHQDTQAELLSLIIEIERIDDDEIKNFFKLMFSSVIVTKTGGVSLALDLAHTRPHRAKIIFSKEGNCIEGIDIYKNESINKNLIKKLKSPIEEFKKKFHQNIETVSRSEIRKYLPEIHFGDAQHLPLGNDTIDLIVTSPPYASNAIDYMRAHKFTLVWFGYTIRQLSEKRKEYIGGESTSNIDLENLPEFSRSIIKNVAKKDIKKSKAIHRYYSEIVRILKEMKRVLKPSHAAILVVGNSIIRGEDIQIAKCFEEIGSTLGFDIPYISVRELDRNKRMMPTGFIQDKSSQIQKRMHEEYVIPFYKP
ncbi:MAG: DNA methyltransferase [Candidatus Kapaibacterium sp.]